MHDCIQEKKIESLEVAVQQIKEFTVELRIFNEMQKEQAQKKDKLFDELVAANQKNERGIEKLEILIEKQNEIIATYGTDIKELKSERNINVMKLISGVVGSFITAVLFALIIFMKDKI